MELLSQSVLVSFRPIKTWRAGLWPFVKEFLALTMMCILLVIPQFSVVYGRVGYIMIITLGSLPKHVSVGRAARFAVVNVLSAGFATAYALMVGAILSAIDPSGATNTAISRWVALTVLVLVTTLLRARFLEMGVAHINACLTCTILLFSSVNQGLPLATTIASSQNLLTVFCFAELISFFSTCAIAPIIARREYRQAIGDELDRLGELLEDSIKLLVKEDRQTDVKVLRSKLALSRGSGPAIEQWQIEASLELGPSFWRAPQAADFVKTLYVAATTIHATAAFAIEQAQRAQDSSRARPPSPSTDVNFGADGDENSTFFMAAASPLMQDDDGAILLLPRRPIPKTLESQSEPAIAQVAEDSAGDDAGIQRSQSAPHHRAIHPLSPNELDPVEQEIQDGAEEVDAKMNEGDADVHRRFLERMGESTMKLVEASVHALQSTRLVAMHGTRQNRDPDATEFATMRRITEEIEGLNHQDVSAAISRGLRVIRLNFVLANLLELASHLEALDEAVNDLFVPAGETGFLNRLRTTGPWHHTVNFRVARRDDLRDAILTNEAVEDRDHDHNALLTEKFLVYVRMLTSTEMRFAAKITFAFALILLISVLVSEIQNLNFVWALYSILATASPTMGGNIFNSINRVIGTVIGCLYAVAAWYASAANPYGIVALSLPVIALVSYFKGYTAHPRLGAQIVIAFTILLYAEYGVYTAHATPTLPIILAAERIVNIIIGVTAVLISSRLIYPYVARTELRKRLGTTLEDLSLLYTQVFASFVDPTSLATSADGGGNRLANLTTAIRLSQTDIYKAKALLAQTVNEPKVRKGPFDRETFEKLISTSQHLLDLLVTCKSLVVRSADPASVTENQYFREHVLVPIHKERRENHAMIALSFYVLAAALKSKRPLPYYLPQTSVTSSRLIRKLGVVIGDAEQERGQLGLEQVTGSSRQLLNYFAFLCSIYMLTIDVAQTTSLVRRVVGIDHTLDLTHVADQFV